MCEETQAPSVDDVHRLLVEPELRRRFGETGPPSDFRIFQCLIRLPGGTAPIVEFNDEVSWVATCKKPKGIRFDKGNALVM